MSDTVTRYYQAVDNNDITALLNLFTDDAVYERPGYPPLNGRADLQEFYTSTRVIQSGAHVITDRLETDRAIAVQGTFTGTVVGGQAVTLRFSDFFEIGPDERITRRTTYFFAPLV
ncbi:MAG: ketosteroid isomerase [Frankiales bacterium]|nr:ketosteroid isomerase [Frankiales bacterium]